MFGLNKKLKETEKTKKSNKIKKNDLNKKAKTGNSSVPDLILKVS